MENAPQVSNWACWWKATWGLFIIGSILGYLNNRAEDLAVVIGPGLFTASLSGQSLYRVKHFIAAHPGMCIKVAPKHILRHE